MKFLLSGYNLLKINLFQSENGIGQAVFRVGVSLTALANVLSMQGDWIDIFGKNGYFRDEVIAIYRSSSALPALNWITNAFSTVSIPEVTTIYIIFYFYIFCLIFLLLGLGYRAIALITWLLNMILFRSAPVFLYGYDFFLNSCLFYLAFLCSATQYSLDAFFWKRTNGNTIFARRVVQGHLCLVYFFSGLSKSIGESWWTGGAIWHALHTKSLGLAPFWYMLPPIVFQCISCSTLILELLYPFFMNWERTRRIGLISIIGMHLGIGFFLQLYYFAAIMIILNLFAFKQWDGHVKKSSVFGAFSKGETAENIAV